MNGDEIVSPRAEGERVGEKGIKARSVKPRPFPAGGRGGKQERVKRQPFGESVISCHASACPQKHSWRDCKRRTAVLVSF